jgi:hypothetical protein
MLRRETQLSPPSRFAILDTLLDQLLDTKKEYLVTTKQVLHPDRAVPVFSYRDDVSLTFFAEIGKSNPVSGKEKLLPE